MKKTALIIPVYNEPGFETLYERLTSVSNDFDIVIIDDGSDVPVSRLLKNSIGTNTTIYRNEFNLGKGASIKRAIKVLVEMNYAGPAIIMDGDGQHAIEDLHLFKEAVKDHPFVIGRRQFSSDIMPLPRIFSNYVSSKLLGLKLGAPIYDSQCGFRALQPNLFPVLLECRENGFQFETEMIIRIHKAGIVPYYVPIRTIYNNSRSHINKLQDIISFLKIYFSF